MTLDGIGNSWPIPEPNKFCFLPSSWWKRRCVFAAASEGERPTATADPMPDSSSISFLYIAVVVCLRSRNDKGKNEKGIKIFWIKEWKKICKQLTRNIQQDKIDRCGQMWSSTVVNWLLPTPVRLMDNFIYLQNMIESVMMKFLHEDR